MRSLSSFAVGNITADTRGSTTYNYSHNNRGRLAGLTIGSTATAGYTYDGLERLAIRATQNMTPAGTTTHYVYDRAGHLIAEATDAGSSVREYIWLDDMPLAVVADIDTPTPNLYFVHADHLDRPIKMTDALRVVVWDAIFKPFGEVYLITGLAANNLRFPGQYFLLESGLHYNWHRHYDPTLGRYTQPDPLGFVNGPGLYPYVDGNPIQRVDPNGQQFWQGVVGLAIVGGAFIYDFWKNSHRSYVEPGPVPLPALPQGICTLKYPHGAHVEQEVRNYTPIPKRPRVDPKDADYPDWPEIPQIRRR